MDYNESFSFSTEKEELFLQSENETNISERDENALFEFPHWFRIVCYVLYNLVFICGLVGNLLVYYTIHYTHPRMKSVQNYFLGNLALGDLLIVILTVPTGYIELLWQYWPFGTVACHLLTPVKIIGVFVSSYTLVALAIDRYLAILYPLQPGVTRKQCKVTILIIWIVAIVSTIPTAIYAQVDIYEASGLPRCGEYGWDSFTTQIVYNLVLLGLQYIFPVCVLMYTYVRISLVVWGHVHSGQSPPTHPSRNKRKSVILTMAVVVSYTLAWLPYNILYIISNNGPEWLLETDFFPYLYITCQFLSMAHSTFNPVIYFWINSKFRRAFIIVFQNKCPRFGNLIGLDRASLAGSWRTSSYLSRSFVGNSVTPNGRNSCTEMLERNRLSKIVK